MIAESSTALNPSKAEEELVIHSVDSFCTFDGPGIRFVVFLQGCPFECLYCANPDTMQYNKGIKRTVKSLVREAVRASPYFSNGGGVTVSGGEPCMQAKYLYSFFNELKKEGIHTALDTNGYIINRYVRQLFQSTDLVLLDVKHIDSSIHKIITGKSNDNVLAFADELRRIQKPTWLRYVLVPGLTDRPEHLHALGQHFTNFGNIEKLEIQPYHQLGKHKWEMLGKAYPLEGVVENTSEQLDRALSIFQRYFKEVVIN
ncbi:MAG: pyruvate formate-lyase-activating protein [Bacteroidota bacterium]